MQPVAQLSKTEKQALVRAEIAQWFDQYHQALLDLRTRANQQHIPFELHLFTKSQRERFTNFANSLPAGRPRLKCLVFLTDYHLNEVELLIEHYHVRALNIIERFELPKHPKLLEKPLIFKDIISVNFSKNPAVSILKIQPEEALEWFEHQMQLIYEHVPQPEENPQVMHEINLLQQGIDQLTHFQAQQDGSKVLKRFYQSGFSYRATLRYANHAKQVISLNEFAFIVSHYHDQLPSYGDSTQLPYGRKKRNDTILKSDRHVVAQTPNAMHYYFWEYLKS